MIVKIKCTKIKRTKLLLHRRARDVIELEKFRADVCVRGYHIYEGIWYAVVSKVLVYEREPNNSQDRYTYVCCSCKKGKFHAFNFCALGNLQNILTVKITQTTVHVCRIVNASAHNANW